MSKPSFIDNEDEVGAILDQIKDEGVVRVFGAPVSYYKMRRMFDHGLVDYAPIKTPGERGHTLHGFTLTEEGRKIVTRHRRRVAGRKGGKAAAIGRAA